MISSASSVSLDPLHHIQCSLDLLADIAFEQSERLNRKEHSSNTMPRSSTLKELTANPVIYGPKCGTVSQPNELNKNTMIYASGKRKRTAVESSVDKRNRLSQNQHYRKKLTTKGFCPIKRGNKYLCSLCFSAFEKEMFVWRHGVKHLDEKPFSCTLCQSTFNRSDSLQRHVRNFHGKHDIKPT